MPAGPRTRRSPVDAGLKLPRPTRGGCGFARELGFTPTAPLAFSISAYPLRFHLKTPQRLTTCSYGALTNFPYEYPAGSSKSPIFSTNAGASPGMVGAGFALNPPAPAQLQTSLHLSNMLLSGKLGTVGSPHVLSLLLYGASKTSFLWSGCRVAIRMPSPSDRLFTRGLPPVSILVFRFL